jgi:hypothetical protein
MSEQKKERKMSCKGFLAKTNTRAAGSALAFLTQYREYLTTSELAPKVAPILVKLDADRAAALAQKQDTSVMAAAALREVQNAVMTHIIESDTKKHEESVVAAEKEAATPAATKNWVATIYNGAGEVCARITNNGDEEKLVKSFDLAQDADRWADRRLMDGAADWYAEVNHAERPIHSRIERDDAMSRVLRKPKGPTVHTKGQSTKSLSWGAKVKETRVSFSRG